MVYTILLHVRTFDEYQFIFQSMFDYGRPLYHKIIFFKCFVSYVQFFIN